MSHRVFRDESFPDRDVLINVFRHSPTPVLRLSLRPLNITAGGVT